MDAALEAIEFAFEHAEELGLKKSHIKKLSKILKKWRIPWGEQNPESVDWDWVNAIERFSQGALSGFSPESAYGD